jgi:hypothetical protein
VSRLFAVAGSPIAVRVLIADANRPGCGAVLLLSRVTRLKGRGDTTSSHRLEQEQCCKPRIETRLLRARQLDAAAGVSIVSRL